MPCTAHPAIFAVWRRAGIKSFQVFCAPLPLSESAWRGNGVDWNHEDVICSIMNLLACAGCKSHRARMLRGSGCLPIHYSLSGVVSQFISASTWDFDPCGVHFEPCEALKAAGGALTDLPSPSSSRCSVALKRQWLPEPSQLLVWCPHGATAWPLADWRNKYLAKEGLSSPTLCGGKKPGSPGSLVLPDNA